MLPPIRRGAMKAIACLCTALALTASPAVAQENALMKGDFHSGGFGGAALKFSEMVDEFAVFVGGRGGWIANHTFVIGGGVYVLVSDLDLRDFPQLNDHGIEFVYGGLEVEYIGLSSAVAHYSVYTLVGIGRWRFTPDRNDFDDVFVVEPAINVELNVARPFRIELGVGYRFVSRVTTPGLENGDLSAFSGALTFKFGSF